jgi:hypothetical protein
VIGQVCSSGVIPCNVPKMNAMPKITVAVRPSGGLSSEVKSNKSYDPTSCMQRNRAHGMPCGVFHIVIDSILKLINLPRLSIIAFVTT